MSRPARLLLPALIVAAWPGWALAETPGIEAIVTQRVASSVEHLASDALEGRGSGAEGGRVAGDWLAAEAAALGLRPGGPDGSFFQPFERDGVAMRNVVATLPGREDGEMVVIGAHYDHLGWGHQAGSLALTRGRDRIHNGADDNASGTAAVLEIARAFVAADRVPRRRVVFVWFDGEERGLLGSRHFLAQPPLAARPVLMINLDMVGRLGRRLDVFGPGTGDLLPGWLEAANAEVGLDLRRRDTMTPNSDHAPFYERKVPVLVPFTGLHADYHRPSDDVERVNMEGIARIARLSYAVAVQAAEAERAAEFRKVRDGTLEAFFEQLRAMVEGGDILDRVREFFGGPRPRARLGVTVQGRPPRVSRVEAGSPAARAGVQVGDLILSVDGVKTSDFATLRQRVQRARGDVTLEVERDGSRRTLQADLGGGRRARPQRPQQPQRPPAKPDGKGRWY